MKKNRERTAERNASESCQSQRLVDEKKARKRFAARQKSRKEAAKVASQAVPVAVPLNLSGTAFMALRAAGIAVRANADGTVTLSGTISAELPSMEACNAMGTVMFECARKAAHSKLGEDPITKAESSAFASHDARAIVEYHVPTRDAPVFGRPGCGKPPEPGRAVPLAERLDARKRASLARLRAQRATRTASMT